MVYLLDTNIIIRFLVGENEKFLEQSTEYFNQIETGALEVEILSEVLMEAFLFLLSFTNYLKMK